jgi:DNA-binding transcriptional MerR regulator
MLKEQRPLTVSQEVAELIVSTAWFRFGERLGALPLARRNQSGWRCYTPADIARLRRLGVGERKRRLESGDE